MRRRVFVFASRRPPAVCSEAVVASVCRSESAQPAAAAQAAGGRPRGVTQAFILRRRRGPAPQSAPDVSAAESSEYRRAAGEQTEPSAAEGAAAEPSAPPGADRGGRRPSPSPGPGPDSSPETVPDRGRCRHGRGSGGTQPRRRPLGKRGTRRRREPSPAALPAQGEPADGGIFEGEGDTPPPPKPPPAPFPSPPVLKSTREDRGDTSGLGAPTPTPGPAGLAGLRPVPKEKLGRDGNAAGTPDGDAAGVPPTPFEPPSTPSPKRKVPLPPREGCGESPPPMGAFTPRTPPGGEPADPPAFAPVARAAAAYPSPFFVPDAAMDAQSPPSGARGGVRAGAVGGGGGDGEWFRKHHGTRKGVGRTPPRAW